LWALRPFVLGFLGVYALLVYFTIKPDWEKLKSLLVGIGLALMATGGFISGIIHFIHFVLSPQAAALLSLVLVILFAFAGVSASGGPWNVLSGNLQVHYK